MRTAMNRYIQKTETRMRKEDKQPIPIHRLVDQQGINRYL
jgi:hypothetical protein